MQHFHEINGWRIEAYDKCGYSVRVCRNNADCAEDVWGYYTQSEVRRNVHFAALARASRL